MNIEKASKREKYCSVNNQSWPLIYIWATSRENLFLPYANNKGADQPAHLRSLISTFVIRCLDSIIPQVSLSDISKKPLPSFCGWAGPFESYLVANSRRLVFSCRISYMYCFQLDLWLFKPVSSVRGLTNISYKTYDSRQLQIISLLLISE